jgi:hypothetical protein
MPPTPKATTAKKAPAKKKPLELTSIVVAPLDHALRSDGRGTYSGGRDMQGAYVFKSAENEMTIFFTCGDTVKLQIDELAEIVAAIKESPVQNPTALEHLLER